MLQEEAVRVKDYIFSGASLSVSGSIEHLKDVDLPLVARLIENHTLWLGAYLGENYESCL